MVVQNLQTMQLAVFMPRLGSFDSILWLSSGTPLLPPPSSNQRKDMMLQVCALASCQVTRLGLRDGAVRTGSTGHAESVSCLLPTLLWRVGDLPHSGA